jgi:hypothetical protein
VSTFLRSGAAALAAVALLATLAVASAPPAAASTGHGSVATPANLTAHPWPHDGCSASPERGPGWDFHHACIHHDGCYRGHWASRRTCDRWFLRDMRSSCQVLHGGGWRRWPCVAVAAVYHSAVRLFGASAYDRRRVDVPVR